MFTLSHATKKRVFTASWLLLYAVAGLIVHAPFGHMHHHAHGVHGNATGAVKHAHSDHKHDHHSHSHGTSHSHAADFDHAADESSKVPATPAHDDDCAGCQLLGSVSAPTPVLELVHVERLKLAAPVLVILIHAVDLTGVSLARAPPASV